MFEHVGVKHYREFFGSVERLSKRDGVALLHAIGRRDGPGFTNPWLRKYIFPGGYSPALSEVVPFVERTGMWITDIEILRLHYAETLRCWRENFNRHRAEIARIYDERFCRMWEFYLMGSELSFRHSYNMVWQMQMSRSIDAVPLTRDYIMDLGNTKPPCPPGAVSARPRGAVIGPYFGSAAARASSEIRRARISRQRRAGAL